MRRFFSLRVFTAAVLLPGVMVCADQSALALANSHRWSWLPTLLVFATFTAQSFVLAQAVGRWLPDWRWRLGVLAWSLVLVNVLLFRASIEAGE